MSGSIVSATESLCYLADARRTGDPSCLFFKCLSFLIPVAIQEFHSAPNKIAFILRVQMGKVPTVRNNP